MRTATARLAAAAVALSILVAAGLVARQAKLLDSHFIFFPERELVATPGDVGLGYEDVFFSAADGVKLHGWFVPAESDIAWVWFHGNAGNISHRVENILMLHQRLGVSIFIFDYRGYGRSEGKPSEGGTYLDAEAALDYVRSRHSGKLVLFGRSLGCAVAAEMATRRQVHAVVLESPFTSVRALGGRAYPFLPVGVLIHLVEARYDALSKVKNVRSPVMVLHGDRDGTVPIEMGKEVYEAANEPKRFYTIRGADHNDTYLVGGDAYFDALRQFIEDPTGIERPPP